MAIGPRPPALSLANETDSPIENELAAYRALSPLAVACFVFGLASSLVFTSLNFASLGGLAIVLGLLAHRHIRKLPDVLTGTKLANAGIGLALAFTLAAFTVSGVQGWIYGREAAKFARTYVDAIRDGTRDDLVYFQIPASQRVGKTPKRVVQEAMGGERDAVEFDMRNAGTTALAKRLGTNPRPTIEYAGIESQATDGLTLHASALVKITDPSGSKPEYALVHLMGNLETPGYAWMVKELDYPHKTK